MVRFGVFTDVHYADKAPAGTRYYRDSLDKLRVAADAFRSESVDFVLGLGDFIDEAPNTELEREWLRRVIDVLADHDADGHLLFGNHCLSRLTRDDLESITGTRGAPFAFEEGGLRFVAVDACYREDGVAYAAGNFEWTDTAVPEHELERLERELGSSPAPAVVLVHQRVDTTGDFAVSNGAEVRERIARSRVVRLVLQGHAHRNECRVRDRIPYVTLRGMIEGAGPDANAFAIVEIREDGTIRIEGRGNQTSYFFEPGPSR